MTDSQYYGKRLEDTAYGGAVSVVEKEFEHIEQWRGRTPESGIALSGGGIRSASFALGVLQALAHQRCLPRFDYLSTVSGGGYIGASLTYLLHQSTRTDKLDFDASREHFPYLSYPMVRAPSAETESFTKGRLLHRLRQNTEYLTPGRGFSVLTLCGVFLRSSVASVLVHGAILVVVFGVLISLTQPARSNAGRAAESTQTPIASPDVRESAPGGAADPANSRKQSAPPVSITKPTLGDTTNTASQTSVVSTSAMQATSGSATGSMNSSPVSTPSANPVLGAPDTAASSGAESTQTSKVSPNVTPSAPGGATNIAVSSETSVVSTNATQATSGSAAGSKNSSPTSEQSANPVLSAPDTEASSAASRKASDPPKKLYDHVLDASVLTFAIYAVGSLLYIPFTRLFPALPPSWPYRARRFYERSTHYLLLIMLATLVVAAVPWIYGEVPKLGKLDWGALAKFVKGETNGSPGASVIAVVGGLISHLWAFLQTRSAKKPKIPTGLLVAVGSGLLLLGVALFAFHIAVSNWVVMLPICLLVLVFVGLLADVNYVSIHRYYRDRLMETFMMDAEEVMQKDNPNDRTGKSVPGNFTMLADVCGAGKEAQPAHTAKPGEKLLRGPYHIINTNVVLVGSKSARYRGRRGDNFILSPLFSGSRATGWKRTDASSDGVTLATAMAISGAAVNPNAAGSGEGVTCNPVLSVLMGLLNVRLGYWHSNPVTAAAPLQAGNELTWLGWLLRRQKQPNLISPGLLETFGRGSLNENAPFVLLTDGGHFENLGLYELIRRRLKLIVVSDGTEDEKFSFCDLANAIERVRVDFGANIELQSEGLAPLIPKRASSRAGTLASLPVADCGYVLAKITYASREPRDGECGSQQAATLPEEGLLIYITTNFHKGLTADLHGYRQAHRDFPDQPTKDQFFDEKQFEAYRELGYQTCHGMLESMHESWVSNASARDADYKSRGLHVLFDDLAMDDEPVRGGDAEAQTLIGVSIFSGLDLER